MRLGRAEVGRGHHALSLILSWGSTTARRQQRGVRAPILSAVRFTIVALEVFGRFSHSPGLYGRRDRTATHLVRTGPGALISTRGYEYPRRQAGSGTTTPETRTSPNARSGWASPGLGGSDEHTARGAWARASGKPQRPGGESVAVTA